MNTGEMIRTWALLSWKERAIVTGRAVGASIANGIGTAGSAYLVTQMAGGDFSLEFRPLLAAGGFGAVLGLLLFLARPGLRSWRRD